MVWEPFATAAASVPGDAGLELSAPALGQEMKTNGKKLSTRL